MTMITPSYLGETIEYSSLHACRSTLEDPTGLMADYNLSTRTDVYVQGTYLKVVGGQSGTVLDDAFITGTQGSSSTSAQFVARVALRHKF